MNNREKAATAILAARASSQPVYVFIEPPWMDGAVPEAEVVAEKQREHPMSNIVSVCWGPMGGEQPPDK